METLLVETEKRTWVESKVNNNKIYLTRVKHIDYDEYEVGMKLNTKKRNALL